MTDNKHFIQFLNQLGITTNQLATALDMRYETARHRVDTLKFTAPELCKLSEFTTVPILDIINIIINKTTLKEVTIPYAITKEMALEKLRQDDEFIRMILEVNFVGAGQKNRPITQIEIAMLKSHFRNYKK